SSFMTWVTADPFVLLAFMLIVPALLFYLVRLLTKPNKVALTEEGLEFKLSAAGATLAAKKVSWSTIAGAHLWKPANSAGPEHWKIRLDSKGGKKDHFIELAAL